MRIIVDNQLDIEKLKTITDGTVVELTSGHQVTVNVNSDTFVWNNNKWEELEIIYEKKWEAPKEVPIKKLPGEVEKPSKIATFISSLKKDDVNDKEEPILTENYNAFGTNGSENFENLTFENVVFKYDKNKAPALDDISFKINKGEFHAFIGENGAGKSTTIKIITGENDGYRGLVNLNNRNITKNTSAKQKIAYVADTNKFPRYLSVEKYLFSIGYVHNTDAKVVRADINFYLERFGISDVKNKNPNKLSLGQQKKVLLIRCLLENAQLIVLDEPAANLDPTTKLQIFELLKQIQKAGVTIFISTHLLDDIKGIATNLTLISEGKILYSNKVDESEFDNITKKFFTSRQSQIQTDEIVEKVISRGQYE